jgi:flavin reductase (DIM6/NTAB) family NADH-FMN oxidoreductase RutF
MHTTERVPLDARHFRNALSQFATGVAVVTCKGAGGQFRGVTISSFNSVSLAPPLILWSLAEHVGSMPAFSNCTHYMVNVLSAGQSALARRFAAPIADRFEGVDISLSAAGLPILAGAAAWFECRNRNRHPEGDHVIFVGEVEECNFDPRPALLFHQGQLVETGA